MVVIQNNRITLSDKSYSNSFDVNQVIGTNVQPIITPLDGECRHVLYVNCNNGFNYTLFYVEQADALTDKTAIEDAISKLRNPKQTT